MLTITQATDFVVNEFVSPLHLNSCHDIFPTVPVYVYQRTYILR